MNAPANPFEELENLAAALCDETLSPSDAERLERLAGQSPEAMRFFLDYMQLHGELYWEHAGIAVAAVPPETASRRRWPAWAIAGAAAVLAAISLAIVWNQREPAPTIARVVRTTNAVWRNNAVATDLPAGRQVELTSGTAQLEFSSGAVVVLESPAIFEPITPNQCRLSGGRATIKIPAAAVGFAVDFPNGRVVDLGTEFAVAVDAPDRAEVHVFKGIVDVFTQQNKAKGQRLEAGKAVQIAGLADAAAVQSIEFGDRAFAGHPAAERGSVARLRALVAAHPHLIHHYPFEGATPREIRQDQRGDLHLNEVVMYGGSGNGTVKYNVAGIDASTKAVRTHRARLNGNSQGVALQSESDFKPPPEMTLELLLRLEGHDDEAAPVQAAVATRADDRNCGFFLAAVDEGQLVQLFDADQPWLETGVRATPGHWYYAVVTFRRRENGTIVDAYLADLTRGDDKIRQVVVDRLIAGHLPASRLGIGKSFNADGAHAYPWNGSLDEIAIYDRALDPKTIENHLKALR